MSGYLQFVSSEKGGTVCINEEKHRLIELLLLCHRSISCQSRTEMEKGEVCTSESVSGYDIALPSCYIGSAVLLCTIQVFWY